MDVVDGQASLCRRKISLLFSPWLTLAVHVLSLMQAASGHVCCTCCSAACVRQPFFAGAEQRLYCCEHSARAGDCHRTRPAGRGLEPSAAHTVRRAVEQGGTAGRRHFIAKYLCKAGRLSLRSIAACLMRRSHQLLVAVPAVNTTTLARCRAGRTC